MVNSKIKEFRINVSEMANAFKCTRPTIYSYIKAYDMKRSELIPDDVKGFLDFVDASEYLSNQNIFILLHGGDPRKKFGEDNPLFIEGIVYLKSNKCKQILGELKKEHSFPERKGKYVHVFTRVSNYVQITFVLLDTNIEKEHKYYSKLAEAKEIESLEQVNNVFKEESVRVLSTFKENRKRQEEESYKMSYEELQNLVKEIDENAKNLEHFNDLKKKVLDYIYNLKFRSHDDIEKLEIIQKVLNL